MKRCDAWRRSRTSMDILDRLHIENETKRAYTFTIQKPAVKIAKRTLEWVSGGKLVWVTKGLE